jgi:EAL domain-containing protein (putative c-di-GMP-specific phosphodiesterase class I)
MLEAAIAHEQVDVFFQPLIVPAAGRIVGAEALPDQPLFPKPRRYLRASAAVSPKRLSRLVQRKALRSAAAWEGPLKGLGISINILAGRHFPRGATRAGCSTRSVPPASIRGE